MTLELCDCLPMQVLRNQDSRGPRSYRSFRTIKQTRSTIWTSALIVFALVASGCSASSGAGSEPSPSKSNASKISWRRCSGGECGSMKVGLRASDNPRAKGAKVINLELFRAKAAESSKRIGVLLINPGGPGGSGFDAARSLATALPATIRNHFDIVGWDPRGTGRSTHIQCGDRLDYLFNVDTAPDSATERRALERVSKRFAETCAKKSGDLLSNVSSFDTVRDMESIRSALHEKKINFLGYSYGTFLGALYARDYPKRVRSMVLDGAVDPSLSPEASLIEQAQGLGRSLKLFFNWCDSSNNCAIGARRASRGYEALRLAIDKRPLRLKNRVFGPTQFDLAVSSFLYSGEAGYEYLAAGLEELLNGDPATLLESADAYVGRSSSGNYDGSWSAFLAVNCLDGPSLGNEVELAAASNRAGIAAKDFGAASVGLGYPCAAWGAKALLGDAQPISAKNAPPIVIIGTRDDPITPVTWAEGLAAQLGNGHLVVAPGAQHTSYPSRDGCLDPIINSYFVRLRVPPEQASCPAPQVVIARGFPVI